MSEAVVILAAGSGSRFEGPSHKLLAEAKGRPVLSWVMDAVVDLPCDEVVVVSGAVDISQHVPERFTLLRNEDWEMGLASSLIVGVGWARLRGHDAITVGLGDQPGIDMRCYELVLTSRRKPLSVATYGGRRRNPVRLHHSIWELLPISGENGAKMLMESRPDLVEEVECLGDPFDIDTVEDLESWT